MTGSAGAASAGHDTAPLEFQVRGQRVAGLLRTPRGAAGPLPGVVLTGPFTGVKEQVVSVYARRLASQGLVTLVFDHRGFGASEGEPRQHEDAAGKLADLRAATSALAAQPGVDAARLGCVGICLGGGYALRHSAFDPRIRAAAFVAAAFNDPRAMREGMGEDGYRAQLRRFAEADQREFGTGEPEYLPAVDRDGGPAAMPGREPWDYYGTGRSAAPGWQNRVTLLSIRELLTFDAAIGADFLAGTPALFIHGRRDDFCSPSAAEGVCQRAQTGDKEFVWLDTSNHIDLYDNPVFVDPAAAHLAGWLLKRL
ncbi:MAG: alpha/beta hydrolase [Gemmatimonadota bacterium]